MAAIGGASIIEGLLAEGPRPKGGRTESMAGKIQDLINHIINTRSGGDQTIRRTTRAKLLLKGIDPNIYTAESEDDPAIIDRLRHLALEMGVTPEVKR